MTLNLAIAAHLAAQYRRWLWPQEEEKKVESVFFLFVENYIQLFER